jgi:hypothetical protein
MVSGDSLGLSMQVFWSLVLLIGVAKEVGDNRNSQGMVLEGKWKHPNYGSYTKFDDNRLMASSLSQNVSIRF